MQRKEHGTCGFGVGIEAGMFSVPEVETKIGVKIDGDKKTRVCRKCGEAL